MTSSPGVDVEKNGLRSLESGLLVLKPESLRLLEFVYSFLTHFYALRVHSEGVVYEVSTPSA